MHQTSAYRRSSPLSALPLSRTSSLLAVTRMPLSSLPIPRASRSNVRQHRALTVTNSSVRARWHFDVKWGKKADAIQLLQEWVSTVGHDAGLTTANARITAGLLGAPESRLELEVEVESLAALEQFWGGISPAAHKAWSQRAAHCIIDGTPKWDVLRSFPAFVESESPATAAMPASAPLSRDLSAAPSKKSASTTASTTAAAAAAAAPIPTGSLLSMIAPTEEEMRRYAAPSGSSSSSDSAGSIQLVPMTEASAAATAASNKQLQVKSASASRLSTSTSPMSPGENSNTSPSESVYAPEPPPPLEPTLNAEGMLETVDWKGDKITFSPGDKIPFKF